MTAFVAVLITILSFGVVCAQESTTESASDVQASDEYTAPQGYDKHHLCWVEFKSNDLAASEKFYTHVFGWFIAYYDEDPSYSFFQPPSGLMGGFNSGLPEDAQSTTVYIYVPDVDAALADVEACGGKPCGEKMPVGGHGFIGFFNDPNGLMMGIADMYMKPEDTPYPFGEGAKPAPNTICLFEFFGGDMAKSSEFYAKAFGWNAPVNPDDPNHLVFSTGAGTQGVFIPDTEAIPVLAYIWVDDVAATIEKIEAAGGKRYMDPFEAAGKHFGYFYDPSGVVVGLLGEK